jgi:menaquinone-dependent protoporphyrinogen oxidase
MKTRILIAYATRAGSTVEVAQVIGEILADAETVVDIFPVSDVTDLAGYQAVIIGSPIHSGQWLPEATTFVDTHKITLRNMPVACFVLAMRLRDKTEETRNSIAAILNPVRMTINPVSIGLFAGVMNYSKLSSILRLQAQTKGLPEGDFRDWDAIRKWANELPSRLYNNAGRK